MYKSKPEKKAAHINYSKRRGGFFRFFMNEMRAIIYNRKLVLCFLLFLVMNVGLLTVAFDTDEVDSTVYTRLQTDTDSIMDMYMEDPESETYKQLYDEYTASTTYDEYLQQIIEDAEKNQSISIFQTKFSISNLERTKRDFERLVGTEVFFVGGYGVCKALNFTGSYILIFFFLVVLVLELVLRDKKNGLANLYKTTWNGDSRLLLSKYAAAVVYMALFVAGISLSNFLVAEWKFGAVDLSAPVQSLMDYIGYGFSCRIGTFAVLVCVVKILIFSVILAALFTFAVISSNEIMLCVWTAAAMFVELLFSVLGERLNLIFLYRFSIFSMLDTTKFFQYENYNLMSHARPAIYLDCVVCAVLIAGLLIISSVLYLEGSSDYQETRIRIKRKAAKAHKTLPSIWRLEGYKLWMGYKMIFVILLLVIFQVYIYQNKSVRWSTNEYVYQYYISQIEGVITQGKLDYITSEAERYANIHKAGDQVEQDYDTGKITEEEYSERWRELNKQLENEEGFNCCQEYVDYIKEQCGITSQITEADPAVLEQMGFVYNRGWNILAGGRDYKDDVMNAAKIIVVLMLTTAFLYLEDYRYKINGIIDITENYRKLHVIKAVRLFLTILVIYIMVYLPELMWVKSEIGLTGGKYLAQSLPYLVHVSISTSITGYFLLVYSIRLLTILILTGLYVLVGKLIRNTNGAIFCAAAVVLLPLLLYLSGFTAAKYYPLVQLLSGNMLLR